MTNNGTSYFSNFIDFPKKNLQKWLNVTKTISESKIEIYSVNCY